MPAAGHVLFFSTLAGDLYDLPTCSKIRAQVGLRTQQNLKHTPVETSENTPRDPEQSNARTQTKENYWLSEGHFGGQPLLSRCQESAIFGRNPNDR